MLFALLCIHFYQEQMFRFSVSALKESYYHHFISINFAKPY